MPGRNHPHDARLIARHFEPSSGDAHLERHVRTCARCAARQREIAAILDDRHPVWRDDDAQLLREDWLDAQRRRIQERLETRPGSIARVIPFPRAGSPAVSTRPMWAVRSRLAAVAAIMALVGAAGVGWVFETQRHDGLAVRIDSRRPGAPAQPRAQPGQEALLADIEMALARQQTPALRALDELTAGAAEIPGR